MTCGLTADRFAVAVEMQGFAAAAAVGQRPAEAHGAQLRVESVDGEGTTISLGLT